LLIDQGRLSDALPLLQASAVWSPDVAEHHRDLAMVQLFFGEVPAGRDSMIKSLELDRHGQEVLYNLVHILSMADGSEQSRRTLAIAEELASAEDALPPHERAQVLFSLGKAYDDLDRIEDSTQCYRRANAIRRTLIGFDVGAIEERYRRIAACFDREFFRRIERAGVHDSRPVFIVGMPRAGSTLVEQILSAHPDVHAAGEMYRLPPIVNGATDKEGRRFPDWSATINEADCNTLGLAYLDGLPRGLPGQTRTTDKWLENLEYLGVICASLPDARIIHCRRDPRDQLFSCWTTLFSNGQGYSYDIGELTRYWRAYETLMAHWREVLPPGRMLEVQYEELVSAFEEHAHGIVQHCGLKWDEHVLRFWTSRRPVMTASFAQVREPVYDHSVGRWKRFAETLQPLFETEAAD